MPTQAPTDSWKPTLRTRNGSTTTNPVTAKAKRRVLEASRPSVAAVTARTAITDARSTDGSKRVTNAKKAITASVAGSRVRRLIRRSSGPVSASTKATF